MTTRRLILMATSLMLFTGLPYLQVGDLGFINWDDPTLITDNPVVKAGLTWEGVRQVWHMAEPFPMPMTFLTFMTQAELFGLDPARFHQVGVAGHIFNTLLFFALVWRLTGRPAVAWLAGAWFGLHPLRVEAVIWVTEQKEIGAALFGLLAVHAWLTAVRHADLRFRFLTLAVLAHAASLLYKPQWVTLPLLLLLLDHWPLGRTGWKSLMREKLGFFVVSGAITLLTLLHFDGRNILLEEASHPLSLRLANAVVSIGAYLTKTFWPTGLAVYYPMPAEIPLLSLAVWLPTLGLLTWFCWQKPWLRLAWLWFLIALLPVAGILNSGEVVAYADRWTYLPHMGLVTGLAMTVGTTRPWFLGLSLAVLATLTWHQVPVWTTSETLWQRVLDLEENNAHYFPRFALGKMYQEQGRLALAQQYLAQARALAPDNPYVALELGNVLSARHGMEQAAPQYLAMAAMDQASPQLLGRLTFMLLANRHPSLAVQVAETVSRRWSHAQVTDEVRLLSALALEELGQGDTALRQFLQEPNRCPLTRQVLGLPLFDQRFPLTRESVALRCP